MSFLKIITVVTSLLLVLSTLQYGAAATPSAPTAEDGAFAYRVGTDIELPDAFLRDLEAGDAPAASRVLEDNIAPAYSTGAVPLSVLLIADVVFQAAEDLNATDGASNTTTAQQVYEKAFAQLPEIAATNRSTAVQGFARAIEQTMTYLGKAGHPRLNLAGPVLALANAADLDDAFVVAFAAAKAKGFSAGDMYVLIRSLNDYGQPGVPAAATAAAIDVYGATSANLAQAQGNTSAIGELLLGSAIFEGNSPAAAQNLSNLVQAESLLFRPQQETFAQAILQGMQHLQTDSCPLPTATALLIDAAVIAQNATAVSEAFSQAMTTPLQLFCQVVASATELSSAAGLAASSAIPGSFGPDPCANSGSYHSTLKATGPQTWCAGIASYEYGASMLGKPSRDDCQAAASQLQQQAGRACIVPNATASRPLPQQFSGYSGRLARFGSCQIIIGGDAGQSLPCSQIVTLANDLAVLCSNSQMSTGVAYYPDGFLIDSALFVALSS